ncbi:MAG: nitroreductase family protein [Clostridiales bacterium]|jgi:nitroreductase|nr:nitroreductase family protein [Clostridiales bacterium]
MNETLKNIKERCSCRDFTEQSPTNEQLTAIAQAAIQSPSGMNRQFWHVIVVTNKELISEMEKEGLDNLREIDESLYQHVKSRGGALFYHAPCMVFFPIKAAQPAGAELIDLGIIAQNTVLAATSLGLASVHCGLAAFAFAGNKNAYFKDKLKFPNGYECGMAVLLGYATSPGTPHEPDQSKILFIK